jgi:hypothetical protein
MMRLSAAFMRRGAEGVAEAVPPAFEDTEAAAAKASAPVNGGIAGCKAGLMFSSQDSIKIPIRKL